MKAKFLYRLSILLAVSFCWSGCYCEPGIVGHESTLQTDLPGKPPLLLYSAVKSSGNTRQFLLFVKGAYPLYVQSGLLEGEYRKYYRTEGPKFPFLLKPGKEHGKQITVHFEPSGVGYFPAILRFFASRANDQQAEEHLVVRLSNQEIQPFLAFSCGKELDFGKVHSGRFKEQNCFVSNLGSVPIHLLGISLKSEQGDAKSFTWKSTRSFPLTLNGNDGNKLLLKIRYHPVRSTFQMRVKPDISSLIFQIRGGANTEKLQTRLRIRGKVLLNPLELIPLFPTCQKNEHCLNFGKDFSCKVENWTQQKRCSPPKPERSSLLFPTLGKGMRSVQSFLVRNRSYRPIELSNSSKDIEPFQILDKVDGMIVLPRTTRLLRMEFVQKEAKSYSNFLTVSTIQDTHIFSKVLQLRTQNSSCVLEVQPSKILFEKETVKQLVVSNVGKGTCFLYQVAFKYGNKTRFTISPQIGSDEKLRAGEERRFSIGLKSEIPWIRSDILNISSNDRARPLIDIPIRDIQSPKAPCILRFDKISLDFGKVGVGQTRFQTLSFANIGFGDCLITSVVIEKMGPLGPNAFTIDEGPHFPKTLEGGKQFFIRVNFAPKLKNLVYNARFVIRESKTSLLKYVPMEGTSFVSCIQWTKRIHTLDFGQVPVGCSNRKKSIQLYHSGEAGCPAKIQVKSIRCGARNCGPVQSTSPLILSGVPKLPAVLEKGKPLSFSLAFSPRVRGVFRQKLMIGHDVPGHAPLQISMEGFGLERSTVTESFRQAERLKKDILFVIADSPSMVEEQASLKKNLSAYVQWLVRTGWELRLGVITTDISGKRFPGGCLRGKTKMVTLSTPKFIDTFLQNADVGTSGSSITQGMEAAHLAVTTRSKSGGCNEGFFRKDAELRILFISDQDDMSPRPISFYRDAFRKLKGLRNTGLVRGSVTTGPPPSGCRNPGSGNASSAPRYWTLARLLRGTKDSICHANWAAVLSSPGYGFSYHLLSKFKLSYQALPKSIRVQVGSKNIKESTQDGWQYEAVSNAIHFSRSQRPPPGATITVRYTPICAPSF